MAEIRECPFCLCDDDSIFLVANGPKLSYAHCDNCSARGPMGFGEAEATRKWNSRCCNAEDEKKRMAEGLRSLGMDVAANYVEGWGWI